MLQSELDNMMDRLCRLAVVQCKVAAEQNRVDVEQCKLVELKGNTHEGRHCRFEREEPEKLNVKLNIFDSLTFHRFNLTL